MGKLIIGQTVGFVIGGSGLLHVECTASSVESTGLFGTPGDTDISSPVPLPAAA